MKILYSEMQHVITDLWNVYCSKYMVVYTVASSFQQYTLCHCSKNVKNKTKSFSKTLDNKHTTISQTTVSVHLLELFFAAD